MLAPTDPVLASDVQVGEPSEDEESEDEVRFALTSEAGLNDGLAFPFTFAAIAMATKGAAAGNWVGHWLLVDVGYRIAAGIAVGYWNGEQDVIDNWAEGTRWTPQTSDDERGRQYRNWKKAVQRTLDWVDEDVL